MNITADSFSDGGLYLEPSKAVAHAEELLAAGADVIELGAASSHPDAAHVSDEQEISRLEPVLARLPAGMEICIDSTQVKVQRFALGKHVRFLNDIRGFPDPSIYADLRSSTCMLIVMHSITQTERACRVSVDARGALESVTRFFDARLREFTAVGIDLDRVILDPGMGFFLASEPKPSLAMLAELPRLRQRFGRPLFVSVSRKSFLRNLPPSERCDIRIRTLAAELFLWHQNVEYIRTHDVAALSEAMATFEAITGSSQPIHDPIG